MTVTVSRPPRKSPRSFPQRGSPPGVLDKFPPPPVKTAPPSTTPPEGRSPTLTHSHSYLESRVGSAEGREKKGVSRIPRVAIYIRVSTLDQNPQLQFDELREYCDRRGWIQRREYVDHGISSKLETHRRPGLHALLAAIHAHDFDIVLIWRLDRLARSLAELVRLTEIFRSNQVEFISLKNPGLDTTTPQGKLFFGISAVFAEFERDLIVERTRAGLAAARARGKKLGRPPVRLDNEAIRKFRAMGLSMRQIAKSFGVSKTLINRILLDRRSSDRRED